MGKKVFVIDTARYNGCYNCQIVCKDEHVGNDWSPIAKPQPEIYRLAQAVREARSEPPLPNERTARGSERSRAVPASRRR